MWMDFAWKLYLSEVDFKEISAVLSNPVQRADLLMLLCCLKPLLFSRFQTPRPVLGGYDLSSVFGILSQRLPSPDPAFWLQKLTSRFTSASLCQRPTLCPVASCSPTESARRPASSGKPSFYPRLNLQVIFVLWQLTFCSRIFWW